MVIKYLIFGILACIIIYTGYEIVRVIRLIQVSKELVMHTVAFSFHTDNPTQRVLIIGDSLEAGVGTVPERSIAEYLHRDFPHADITNAAVSGYKIKDALTTIAQFKGNHYDVVIVQIGANDIVQLTPFSQAMPDLKKLLDAATLLSDHVIYLAAGNIGNAPLIPFPINALYTYRSQSFLAQAVAVAHEEKATYIELYYSRADDPFLKDPKRFYGADSFHLSADGYAVWYSKIKAELPF